MLLYEWIREKHNPAQTGEKKLKEKPNEKKKTTTKNGGVKMLMTKRHISTKSSDQHRLILLTEVKTQEYRSSFTVHGKI